MGLRYFHSLGLMTNETQVQQTWELFFGRNDTEGMTQKVRYKSDDGKETGLKEVRFQYFRVLLIVGVPNKNWESLISRVLPMWFD